MLPKAIRTKGVSTLLSEKGQRAYQRHLNGTSEIASGSQAPKNSARETQGATPPTLQPKQQTETTDEAKKKKKTLLGGVGGGGGGGLKTTLG